MSEIMIIGIAGGTGSGKTTLVSQITNRLKSNISIINHDNYYKAHNELSLEERQRLNYDHPDAFETELLIKHILELKSGRSVQSPVYDFTTHNRGRHTLTVYPTRVIIVEGILILADSRLSELMDIRIYVDTDADIRILRRLQRDVELRGRTLESVIDQYIATVKPMHEAFVEPSKRNAHIIIPDGGYNWVALDMIMERIYAHVNS